MQFIRESTNNAMTRMTTVYHKVVSVSIAAGFNSTRPRAIARSATVVATAMPGVTRLVTGLMGPVTGIMRSATGLIRATIIVIGTMTVLIRMMVVTS